MQTTIDAARLFREGECKALLQEARLTASDLDRAKMMFEVDRPLFHDFFSSRARFLGFTAAALLKSDDSIVEKIDSGAVVGNAIPEPDASDFDDARKNEPLCLVLDQGRTFAALRALNSFQDTYLYVARPVDPFTVEFPRQAAGLVALYDGFDCAPARLPDRLRDDVRPDRADHAAVGDLARPFLRQSPRRADPAADRGDRSGLIRQSQRSGRRAQIGRRSRPSRRDLQQDDLGAAAAAEPARRREPI